MTRTEAARALVALVVTAGELQVEVEECDQRIARAKTEEEALRVALRHTADILNANGVGDRQWFEAHHRCEHITLSLRTTTGVVNSAMTAKTSAVEAAKEHALTIAWLLLSNDGLMDHIKDLACAPE